jgi:hypothetical protein
MFSFSSGCKRIKYNTKNISSSVNHAVWELDYNKNSKFTAILAFGAILNFSASRQYWSKRDLDLADELTEYETQSDNK